MVETQEIISRILELSWLDLNHEQIKYKIGDLLSNLGYTITFEYPTKQSATKNGYIDLVAQDNQTGFLIGVEIDRATPKYKSVEKLIRLKPNLALMVLRSSRIPIDRVITKLNYFHSPFVVLSLSDNKVVFSSLNTNNKESKKYSFREVRLRYPNAYEKWSEVDDERLNILVFQGRSTKELAVLFGRKQSAINSRLRKLIFD